MNKLTVCLALVAIIYSATALPSKASREAVERFIEEYNIPKEKAHQIIRALETEFTRPQDGSRACAELFCTDPDCGRNVSQLITARGYPVEDHYALTPDGYFLSMQHIPHGRNSSTPNTGPPVLLQHGLLDASHTWVINFPAESLGFILADAGYDVWLGNNRGNTYSDLNVNYSVDDADFWKFDWDQMASSDLPTQIDYVLQQTGHDQLFYVGHSEGTTQAFSGFTNATTASKVKLWFALAPVAYTGHISSNLIQVMADLRIDTILEILGWPHFLVSSCLIENFDDFACSFDDAALCQVAMCVLMGCNPSNLNATRYQIYGRLDPAGTSVQNMNHWGQMTRKDNFCHYDYVRRHENEKHYGQAHPPCYDLSQMSAPVALFSGGIDTLADPTDVADTISQLNPDMIVYNTQIPYYDHLDFVWGMDAHTVLYPQILSLLDQYS